MAKADTADTQGVPAGTRGDARFVMPAARLDALLKALRHDGYLTIGPKAQDGAVVLDEIAGAAQLPLGLIDDQEAGAYRLTKAKTPAYFDFTHGAQSWKRYLFPPKEKLWTALKTATGFQVQAPVDAPKYAFIGVRSCELSAISIQDKVFAQGEHVSAGYKARRDQALIVALNCRRAGGTCFCVSQDAGPKVKDGFDLALTELMRKGAHEFLIEAGSERGRGILAKHGAALEARPAAAADVKAADKAVDQAAQSMGRTMPKGARKVLAANLESPRWNDIAKRCLDCANCTLVCPTCFCSTTSDTTSLDGSTAERWRQWDSCFTLDFSYIHGGAVRREGAQRYRQWITHKLTHWHDQFGVSGCVGCGRCITWCPVGIDITAEVKAFAKDGQGKGNKGKGK